MAKDVRSGLTVTDEGMACLALASRCGANAVYRIARDLGVHSVSAVGL